MRVASVPGSHIYVRHLADPETDSVVRLDDPVPADGRTVPGGWWPPLMLEPGWVTDNHGRFDVFHVHFGFDAIGPETLAEVCQELKIHDKPLIYTVHDLRNPHHDKPEAHVEQQDVLVAAASELITLTPGAAQAIWARWQRRTHVLAHPHVLDGDRIGRARGLGVEFVVGVHVKSLRANIDPLPVLDTLADALSSLPNAVLQINVHDEIFDPANHWYAPRMGTWLLDYDRYEHVRVLVHPYFTDDALWDYLTSLTVSVLPYRFGTHSGWLEACFDLGTAVIAPSCGFYHQQQRCGVFGFDEHGLDEASLCVAVWDAYHRWSDGGAAPQATWMGRLEQRRALAAAHRRIYQSVWA